MRRETKAGLVVTLAFLSLLGVVFFSKYRQIDLDRAAGLIPAAVPGPDAGTLVAEAGTPAAASPAATVVEPSQSQEKGRPAGGLQTVSHEEPLPLTSPPTAAIKSEVKPEPAVESVVQPAAPPAPVPPASAVPASETMTAPDATKVITNDPAVKPEQQKQVESVTSQEVANREEATRESMATATPPPSPAPPVPAPAAAVPPAPPAPAPAVPAAAVPPAPPAPTPVAPAAPVPSAPPAPTPASPVPVPAAVVPPAPPAPTPAPAVMEPEKEENTDTEDRKAPAPPTPPPSATPLPDVAPPTPPTPAPVAEKPEGDGMRTPAPAPPSPAPVAPLPKPEEVGIAPAPVASPEPPPAPSGTVNEPKAPGVILESPITVAPVGATRGSMPPDNQVAQVMPRLPVGAPAAAISPPIVVPAPGSTPALGSAPSVIARVESFDEETYACKPGDTFTAISKQKYLTENYAQALLVYNRNHPQASDGVRQEPPVLAQGTPVYIPPVSILEKRYASMIPNLTPIARPTPPSVQPVSREKPVTVPTLGAGPGAAATYREYRVVGKNEFMWEVALKTLGDGSRWPEVYRLNRGYQAQFAIPVGVVLHLPLDARVPVANLPR